MTTPSIRPLGATLTAGGADFAIYSRHATTVVLCLFDRSHDAYERKRVTLTKGEGDVWHTHVPVVQAGQLYGYRLYGPYTPHEGHRFNFNKVVLDPYALAITGTENRNDSWYGYRPGHDDDSFDHRDNAREAPKCIVVDRGFDWGADTPLRVPRHKTIIYELHVRGFTRTFPDLPPGLRGTYAGLAHPSVITYLQRLGITAVELMPVHTSVSERYLLDKGLTDYWGYNTIGFFAPYAGYSSCLGRGAGTCAGAPQGSGMGHGAGVRHGAEVDEFKTMVKVLHAAGIEVILDVVYNHSGEGDQHGPTLSFRGIDNAEYYRLEADKRRNLNTAGTGNRLNMRSPAVLRLILDSLHYWVEEMHVDGFRFDLAPSLSDNWPAMNAPGSFFSQLHQDPVLSTVKLIAEPWDVGDGGYQLGNFYPEWSEWNDKYRDYMRDFWRPSHAKPAVFVQRFMGSPDFYASKGRLPEASLNLITTHDGFTLHDLVSYEQAHNEANGTNKTKSLAAGNSWNCGVEGPTEDEKILRCRARQQRNLLATLFLSQGIPMLMAGDECGRTQNGNDNAFCQDNPISWLDWASADKELLEFTTRLIALRKEHAIFQTDRWLMPDTGRSSNDQEGIDACWLDTEGQAIEDWEKYPLRTFGVYFHTHGLFIAINAEAGNTAFRLPGIANWQIDIATCSQQLRLPPKGRVEVPARSLVVFSLA